MSPSLPMVLLLGTVWSATGDPQPPLPAGTTWQSRPTFWRLAEVDWSPPEDAVFSWLPARDGHHCGHLCLIDRSCVAADLVTVSGNLSCRLATKRGSSVANTTAIAAFVRRGRAELGERCLTDDECWQGLEGAGCEDGVCACRAPPLTKRGDCTVSDCSELTTLGVTNSGQYWVRLDNDSAPIAVSCDMKTDGGGWTVFQRRHDLKEQEEFYRYWHNYRDGFGDVSGQFWLGNEAIHRLTARRPHHLRIDMADFEGNRRAAKYSTFRVAGEADNYRLSVAGFSGDAGDSLSYHNGFPFSTKDRDNDANPSWSCAHRFHGAWWYRYCHASNLNGRYQRGFSLEFGFSTGVHWLAWRGYAYSLKWTAMKLRPDDYAVGRAEGKLPAAIHAD